MAREATELLLAWSQGDKTAGEELFPVVYVELRRLARARLRRERPDHTLQPTALVHEAYLRLVEQHTLGCENRSQFFAIAACMMRRILINHARDRRAAKRGGAALRVPLDEALELAESKHIELLQLDDALLELERLAPRQSQIVELRFFGGLSLEETAQALNISTATVERQWRTARAWLHSRLRA
jgi:RNA polymerase sigma factor (TIGR02999 family)